MFKKIAFIAVGVILVGGALFFFVKNSSAKKEDIKTVVAETGSIIDKALAVGKIEPRQEISVKSKLSGIVRKIYVEVGDQVHIGDPLFEIKPDPTPLEFAETKRQMELAEVAYGSAKKDMERLQSLVDKKLVSTKEYDNASTAVSEQKLHLDLAREKFSLIQSGSSDVAGSKVESILRSPIDGTVMSRLVDVGDPVTPLSSYQEGTELMTLALMEDLLFKGTVDEIDVGKLRVGIPVEVKVGALPKDSITGLLSKLSPKARLNEGSTVFDIEVELNKITGGAKLRAGYSATADIIINRKDSIVLVPERLVTITDSLSTVEIQDTTGAIRTVPVTTGLSDGLNIEIATGVKKGDQIVERPAKQIGDKDEKKD